MLKTVALVFFIFTSLVLGALLAGKTHQANVQAVLNTTWEEKISHQDKEIERLKAAAGELEQKHAQLAARNKATKQALLDAQAVAAAPPTAPETDIPLPTPGGAEDKGKKPANPFSESIAKMMKDPAMKNMMRGTQATVLKQMYGDLVKQWSLSPEETQTFYDVLLDKQMDQMDQGMKLFEKGPDAIKTADVGDPDAKIKASLGDSLYQQYKDYEKTIPARLTVNQFQQQLVSSNTPTLLPAQAATLQQTITEESANLPASYGQMTNGNGKSFVFDTAQMDQFMKSQGELNDRVDARMAGTISADQLQVLKEQQQQMLSTQRMGMEMAAKMMAPSPTP